ncbi:MAG: hypothetical protein K2M00_03890 [Muribaculaceae bacterium]|nr:hypothetical protein [Muribaculaceae bacterium]
MDESNGINDICIDRDSEDIIYDLNGNRVAEKPLPAGIYIINGRKTVIKENF